MRELGAVGEWPAQRDGDPGHHRTADRTARRQQAGKRQFGPGARLPAAESVYVQLSEQPVPPRDLRREMMTDELTDEFEYHSNELDLTGDPADGNWSIRCLDVYKRLGGVPVLNGLNIAIPDETITVVLGPSGRGEGERGEDKH